MTRVHEITRFARWRALPGLCMLAALIALPARADEAPKLRAGEVIEVPAGTVSVLGVDIQRGTPTRVTLKLRATAGAKEQLLVDSAAFRLIAAGVPRAPTTTESVLVERDSAVDFTRIFAIDDKTDDLVLQVRVGNAVERRRIGAGH